MSLVSIILPVYNGEQYLRAALESCLSQTYKNIEIIVVDDGSRDESLSIVKSYQDSRIKIFKHENNRGLPCATNTGFENASGAYLTRFASDDLYAPTAVAEMVTHFQTFPEIDLVYSNQYLLMEPSGKQIENQTGPAERLPEYNTIGLCVFFKKDVYRQTGSVSAKAYLAEDYEYWLRVFLKGFRMSHLDKYLYFYRIHKSSLTGKFSDTGEVQRIALKVQRSLLMPKFWKYRHSLSLGHLRAAGIFRKIGLKNEARKAVLLSFLFNPFSILSKKNIKFTLSVFLNQRCF